MFADGRTIGSGTQIDADICIVGAGAAGITIAHQLRNSTCKIYLLESGALEPDWDAQDLYRGDNIGLPYFALDMCQLRYFGGNSNGWGGWSRPLDPIDFEVRSWVEQSGWPISYESLKPFYDVAASLIQIDARLLDAEYALKALAPQGAKFLPFDPAYFESTTYTFSKPVRLGETYRDEIARSQNITCMLHANVLRLETIGYGQEVTRACVKTTGGNSFTVAAKYFVLATGGVETPRILLHSNDVVAAGLGNAYDLVGRYFMEHPHTRRMIKPRAHGNAVAFYNHRFRPFGACARLSFTEAYQRANKVLGYSCNLIPVLKGHDSPAWDAFRSVLYSLYSPQTKTDPFLRWPPFNRKGVTGASILRLARHSPEIALGVFAELLTRSMPKVRFERAWVLESKGEQVPNRDSRVFMQRERDAFGQQRMQIDWRMNQQDRDTVIHGEALIDHELKRLGLGDLDPLLPGEDVNWPPSLTGGWHQLGTTRMDPDPRQGVVDTNCRVHGTKNLFVAGGPVFPTVGVSPPMLTVVAMAARLADHLEKVVAEVQRPSVLAGAAE